MHDTDKTKAQLIAEMTALRQRVATLEVAEAKRKQTEAYLRQSEQRYRHLMEHSLGLLCIHDLHGILLEINSAAARALGYHPRDGVGKSLREFIAPAVQHQFEAYLERIRQQPTDSGLLRIMTRTGEERVWLYRNVRYDEPARSSYVLGHALDITERVQAEQALKQMHETLEWRVAERTAALHKSEARYRTLIDQAADGILIADAHGTYVDVNRSGCAMLGYSREEVIGRRVGDLILPEDLAREQLKMDTLHAGTPVVSERRLRRKDGTLLPVEISAKILSDGRLQCIVRDITERIRLEEQLRQSQKMEALGTLAGGIAHEFNNVLAMMLGFTELARYQVPTTSPAAQHLQKVLTAGTRAKDLVQQILAFSHPSDRAREPVHLAMVIQEALQLLRASLPTTIEIRQQIVPETGMVLANAAQLHQVLMNLCVNAEYAMRETGGVLEVSAENIEVTHAVAASHPNLQPGSHVCVRVRDTGGGIPPPVIDRIFEPFFTTKNIGEGTGMGLAIAHGIVTRHGGVMTVESTPGEGSTFTIYLPQIIHDTAHAAEPSEPAMPPGVGRILFVDDEEVLARLGQALLERLGYDVVVFTSSLAALEAFQAEPYRFDLVITDQTMPAMTGATLVEELRHIRSDIPIILCTGFSHLMNAEKAEALGVDAFVMKPGVTQELAVAIQQVLAKRSQREP